jgi:hypothetical protein
MLQVLLVPAARLLSPQPQHGLLLPRLVPRRRRLLLRQLLAWLKSFWLLALL